MKISISSASPFHAYELARQVEGRGHLNKLYTAYPMSRVQGISRDKIVSFPWLMLAMKGLQKTGWPLAMEQFNCFTISTFDRWVANNLDVCDIFHHWSSCGTLSQRVARERFNAAILCDRGASHIVFQNAILAEEYSRWRVPYQPIHGKIIERELQEYEEADRIVVPSRFVAQTFVQQGISPAKLEIVPLGVDVKLFRPAPKVDDVFRVVYVGQMSLQKGLPYLLDAISGLNLSNVELWLIGARNPETDIIFKQYPGTFRYLGVLDKRDLHRYYSQASVFVLASIQEGFGLVLTEAMACGVPVISTTNSGGEDLFQNGVQGFIVPIRSPEAIRERIVFLYENPDIRQAMGQAALKRVRDLGGWGDYGEKVTALYESLLREKG